MEISPGREPGVKVPATTGAPAGAKEFLPPLPGLKRPLTPHPGLTPGATLCRASGAEKGRRAQPLPRGGLGNPRLWDGIPLGFFEGIRS